MRHLPGAAPYRFRAILENQNHRAKPSVGRWRPHKRMGISDLRRLYWLGYPLCGVGKTAWQQKKGCRTATLRAERHPTLQPDRIFCKERGAGHERELLCLPCQYI